MTISETEMLREERNIREGGPPPADLDWSAHYRILESVQQGDVTIRPNWIYGIEHQQSSIPAIMDGENHAIYDLFVHDIRTAYRFECEIQDGQVVILGTMHPVVRTGNSSIYIIEDEVIARAQIYPTVLDPRTARLGQAYAETNARRRERAFPEDEPDALAEGDRLPDSELGVEYDVMVESIDGCGDFPQPDWITLATDAAGMPKEMNPTNGPEDILLDIYGAPHTMLLDYRINQMGQVVITASVHPATLEADGSITADCDTIHARSEITTRTEDPRLAAAMREYVRKRLA